MSSGSCAGIIFFFSAGGFMLIAHLLERGGKMKGGVWQALCCTPLTARPGLSPQWSG
jgi:hypothetical protein